MTWNHRVFRHTIGKASYWFTAREVFYDSGGRINGWTGHDKAPGGESVEELVECLELMLKDVRKSGGNVLDAKTAKPVRRKKK